MRNLKHLTDKISWKDQCEILHKSVTFSKNTNTTYNYISKDNIDWKDVISEVHSINEMYNKEDVLIVIDLLKDLENKLLLNKMNTIHIKKFGIDLFVIDNNHRDTHSVYIDIDYFRSNLVRYIGENGSAYDTLYRIVFTNLFSNNSYAICYPIIFVCGLYMIAKLRN